METTGHRTDKTNTKYVLLSPFLASADACDLSERSDGSADKAVLAAMELKQTIDALRQEEAGLATDILNGDSPDEAQLRLTSLREDRGRLETRLKNMKRGLGVHGRTKLDNLLQNRYIQLRMNARALRTRIVRKLRDRKFELERLERSYRNVLNGEYSLLFDCGKGFLYYG